MTNRSRPRVLTFYSYKGGTGRTMALANVAWILASQGKRVLAMDWDMEAPGLHRYFAPFLPDPAWERTDGLLDFLIRYTLAAGRPAPTDRSSNQDWYAPYADLAPFTEPVEWKFQGSGRIDLVGAGRQDDGYPARVHHFDWHHFYNDFGGGAFLDEMIGQLAESYDYVLIDSRTGVSDTAGICTVHLPDELVVLYTLNNQSIEGASGIALDALRQRLALEEEEEDPENPGSRHPFVVFPVPTRVELAEKEKLAHQREVSRRHFRRLIERGVRLRRIENEESYFGRMEVLYDPYYAYDEVLATVADRPNQTNSVLATMELLTGYVTAGEVSRLAETTATRRSEALKRYEAFARAAEATEAEEPEPEYDVFISSGRSTGDLSRDLYDALAPWASVFEPSRTLLPGDSLRKTTARAIERSRAVVFLAAEEASEWQWEEVHQGRGPERRVIPVLVGAASPSVLPEWLRELRGLRIERPGDPAEVESLARDVLRAAGLEAHPARPTQPAAHTAGALSQWSTASGEGEGEHTIATSAPSPDSARSSRAAMLPRRSMVVAAAIGLAAALGAVALVPVLRSDAPSADEMLAALRSDRSADLDRGGYVRRLYEEGRRDFQDVRLTGAILSEVDLSGADLSRADLTNARLLGARLDSATLDGATLTSARLAGASMVGASLRDVALDSLDLRGANLFRAVVPADALHHTHTDASTILPDSSAGPVRRDDDSGLATVAADTLSGGAVGSAEGARTGWVWIGDYDRASGTWTRPRIETPRGAPVEEDPALMKPGVEYRVTGNLVMRESLPNNDSTYFRDVPRVGLARRGSVVLLLDSPEARDRRYAIQYWVRVELLCDATREACDRSRAGNVTS